MIAKRFDHAAGAAIGRVMGVGHAAQLFAQPFERVDARVDSGQLARGDFMGGGAIFLRRLRKRHQLGNVIKIEAKRAGVAQKSKPLKRGPVIAPLATCRARGLGYQPAAFVKADRRDFDAGAPRHLSDGIFLRHFSNHPLKLQRL